MQKLYVTPQGRTTDRQSLASAVAWFERDPDSAAMFALMAQTDRVLSPAPMMPMYGFDIPMSEIPAPHVIAARGGA